ncbi:MAG: hypothetical protein HQ567_11490 [Candidatus Nealsonbacteria bacterium]|nr:hypothetical protein [Candidatus Nealsonbacteria bacterium]
MRTCLAVGLLVTVCAAGCGGDGEQPAPAASDASSTDQSEPVKATPGVGKRGRDYGAGPISTPVAAYFTTKERLQFMQVVQPMQIYRVQHGHFPETHEEFMKEIIEANSLKLPELPAGERYVYDAKKAAEMSDYDPKDPPLLVERSGEE